MNEARAGQRALREGAKKVWDKQKDKEEESTDKGKKQGREEEMKGRSEAPFVPGGEH